MNNTEDVSSDHDQSRPAASGDDNIRDAVTWQDKTTYSMPLPHVYARFVEAGVGRSLRTLQRFCERGHLRAAKYPTDTGDVWYVDPDSVETKIEEIRQVQQTLQRPAPSGSDNVPTTSNDMSHPGVARRPLSSLENNGDKDDATTATSGDNQRQQSGDVARRASNDSTDEAEAPERQTTTDGDNRYVSLPVAVLDALTGQLEAKDEQIRRRDEQLERLVEAHDKDWEMLGSALDIIHKGNFQLESGGGQLPDEEVEVVPAEEIKPAGALGGDYPQPTPPSRSV